MSLKVMICKQDGSPIWQTGIATKNKSGMNFKCQQKSWVMSDANKSQIRVQTSKRLGATAMLNTRPITELVC